MGLTRSGLLSWWNSEKWYIYDGMNVAQERNSSNVPEVHYTRGSDLSGNLSGAGGIGGLLARSADYSTSGGSWSQHDYYHGDLTGNVTYMASSATTPTLRAKYEYVPFGRIQTQSGSLATTNTQRFSSKEQISSSPLSHYGYRFYHAEAQRWLSRDPRGEGWETGELNLYAFVSNDGINWSDYLGLQKGRRGWKSPEKRHVPPKPDGHSGFHHYGNWGGPGWANGGWNSESDPLPGPGDPDYNEPWDERDACYEQHDRCISNCPDPDDWPRCPGRSRPANAKNGIRGRAAASAHSDCVEDCDHKLADCLRDSGHGGVESFMFDTLIPWLIH